MRRRWRRLLPSLERVRHEVGSLEQLGPYAGTLWGCAQPSWATKLGHWATKIWGPQLMGAQIEAGRARGAGAGEWCVPGAGLRPLRGRGQGTARDHPRAPVVATEPSHATSGWLQSHP